MSSQVTLDLFGMTCANCALRIEKGLARVPGVIEARVNFTGETARIVTDESVSPESLVESVRKLGYEALEHDRSRASQKHRASRQRTGFELLAAFVLTTPLLYGMAAHLFSLPGAALFMNPWLQALLAAPVQFILGSRFYRGAWRALMNGSANMDVLVALGTSAAYGYSVAAALSGSHQKIFFETSAVLITFILAGKWLEQFARLRSAEALESLLSLKPGRTRIRRANGSFEETSAEVLRPGDVILASAGESIPADGLVIEGRSEVDESMITGESVPVLRSPGDPVIGGTTNGNGTLTIEVKRTGAESTLSSIIRIVEEAQVSRAPVQDIADRISAYFVPAVVLIASAVLTGWLLLTGDISGAVANAVAVLVISCPCALGLATPVSLLVGTGRAAKLGILFRNARALETLAGITHAAFDKTGTLTRGRPALQQILASGPLDMLLARLASLEAVSNHPLAAAVVREAKARGIKLASVQNLETEPGGGILGRVGEDIVIAGRLSFVENHGVTLPDWMRRQVEAWVMDGQTVVTAFVRGGWLILGLQDELRENARQAAADLVERGITPVLLSGDQAPTVAAAARATGIQEFHAQLSPAQKQIRIQELTAQGFRPAMIGDGINDAPALAAAYAGIAMGSGTDAAMSTADIILLNGDLSKLDTAVALSRATVRNIRENFFWAIAYNSFGIPLAAAGFLSPWIAGAAMAASSLSVVLNALRLKRSRLA